MCGLAGVMGSGIFKKHRDAFKELLYVSALRGREGTGVLAADLQQRNPWFRTFKTVGEPNDFLKDNQGLLSSPGIDLFMGHCRWPTRGKVTKANVHPFDVGRIVGAHNGTLHTSDFYEKDKTDSEVMFKLMEKDGIIPVLEKTRSWDAYSISIFDKQEHTISLATNGNRPLGLAVCKNSDVVFWASEYLMLHAILDRNDIDAKVYNLTPNRLYTLGLDTIRAGAKTPWTTCDIPVTKTSESEIYEKWMRGEISSAEFNQVAGIPF